MSPPRPEPLDAELPARDSRRGALAWAFYDWANSAFATTVLAGFFPLFFKEFWSAGADATTSTLRLGVANSIGSVVVAVLAPVLGAVADAGGLRKPLLALAASVGIGATFGLWFVAQGEWQSAATLFVVASVGFMAGNVFYDSLLVDVAPPERRDRVSALGYGLGYLGGGLLFALNVGMVLSPGTFGLADRGVAVRASFVTVSVWWALFSLPLFLAVREGRPAAPRRGAVARGLRELVDTLREVRALKGTALFLVAYWLYIDGVDTVVRMAVDYGLSIGLEPSDLMTALLVVQLVGFPAAVLFGRLGERVGAKRAVLLAVAVYCVISVGAAFMRSATGFYVLAVAIALVQGGVQALSRSMYSRLVPASRAAQMFGFYNMLGKLAAVLGPLLVGVVGALTGSPRVSIASVVVLFVAGGLLLARVDVDAGERAALDFEAARGAGG